MFHRIKKNNLWFNKKRSKRMNYNIIIDIEKIKEVYHIIKINTKNKNKIIKFELFFISNIMEIYNELKNKTYKHENYNIFLIKENKYRIIMDLCQVFRHNFSRFSYFKTASYLNLFQFPFDKQKYFY